MKPVPLVSEDSMAHGDNSSWKPLDPARAGDLNDARRQLHHAVQLPAAFGSSYAGSQADDSNASLEWLESEGAFASHSLNGRRIALRARDLTLIIESATFALAGRSMSDAEEWIRSELSNVELDPSRFTLEKHYDIPDHPVASGGVFNARSEHLEQLANWFSNSAAELEAVRTSHGESQDVLCRPRPLDVSTLFTRAPGKTVTAGMKPGDRYYDEPYFYVSMYPTPSSTSLPPVLRSGGHWHTKDWIGAVLPGSKLSMDADVQAGQVRQFLESAITVCSSLVKLD